VASEAKTNAPLGVEGVGGPALADAETAAPLAHLKTNHCRDPKDRVVEKEVEKT